MTELEKIDQAISDTSLALSENTQPMRRALELAAGINRLRALITPEMMQGIMALMNSPLGFLTDRDGVTKDKTGKIPPLYTEAVVKECFIESLLRGLRPVGNEWNIIKRRCYVAKEGITRLVRELPGLTDLREGYKLTKFKEGEGAMVRCTATWLLNERRDQLEAEIPVRVNRSMGVDAVFGKAVRKFKTRIHAQVTGSEHEFPDGEVDDAIEPASFSIEPDKEEDKKPPAAAPEGRHRVAPKEEQQQRAEAQAKKTSPAKKPKQQRRGSAPKAETQTKKTASKPDPEPSESGSGTDLLDQPPTSENSGPADGPAEDEDFNFVSAAKLMVQISGTVPKDVDQDTLFNAAVVRLNKAANSKGYENWTELNEAASEPDTEKGKAAVEALESLRSSWTETIDEWRASQR